jgi:hypothetical protein
MPAFHEPTSARPNPVRCLAGHRGTRTPTSGRTGRRQAATAARHTGRAGRLVWSCRYQNQAQGRRQCRRSWRRRDRGWRGWRVGEEIRVVREGGESRRRCASGSVAASGRCASVRGGRRRGRARRRREMAMRACQ